MLNATNNTYQRWNKNFKQKKLCTKQVNNHTVGKNVPVLYMYIYREFRATSLAPIQCLFLSLSIVLHAGYLTQISSFKMLIGSTPVHLVQVFPPCDVTPYQLGRTCTYNYSINTTIELNFRIIYNFGYFTKQYHNFKKILMNYYCKFYRVFFF